MNLFQTGKFVLSSGAESFWKLECDALTDDDWYTLAQMVRVLVGPYSSVQGVPTGGLKLADHLRPSAEMRGPHLIVDDVLTTGASMERLRQSLLGQGPAGRPGVVGAVVFARGQRPHWIRALFQMPECFWTQPLHR